MIIRFDFTSLAPFAAFAGDPDAHFTLEPSYGCIVMDAREAYHVISPMQIEDRDISPDGRATGRALREEAPKRRGLILKRATAALEDALDRPLAPGLYLVATPIGNLADLSIRALAVLAQAEIVYCEDTRHTRKLTGHFGLKAELRTHNDHNAAAERPRILSRLRDGGRIALVSDAGSPLISDPGFKLVRDARAEGLDVFSVPGPTALIAALTSSGLPTDQFHFAGFLPPKSGARKRRLQDLAEVRATLVFYEAPQRLGEALADIASALGDRHAVVAKELTKLHESVVAGPISELIRSLGPDAPKGEFVIVVAPAPAKQGDETALATMIEGLLQDCRLRDVVRLVAEATGEPKNRIYDIALKLSRGASEA